MNRPLAAVVALGAVFAVGIAGWALRPTAQTRPNVLIILWDTVRADRLSLYGHDKTTTPFLEKFARDAVVYDHAIATSEWTGPTHASLFTGLPLRSHGVDTHYKWLDGHYTTLAEQFAEAGYATYAFTGNRFVSDFVNMLQGFQTQDHTFKGRWKKPSRKATSSKLIPRDRSTEISPSFPTQAEGWSKKLTLFKDAAPVSRRAFGQWLDNRPDEAPFFAFINLMEAHQPRIPSLASRKALMDDDTLERALQTDSSLFALMSYVSGKRPYTEAELEAMRATYDASLLDLDKALEAQIDALEARGLLDDTIVVVTADHGELLGEHGLYSHRWALYEPLVHVPLVVHYPAGLQPRRVSETVSIAGVANTLLQLAGEDPMDGAAPPLLDPERGHVVSELRDPNEVMKIVRQAFPDVPADQFDRQLHAIYDGAHKLIRASDHRHELYDLASDPTETNPLTDPARQDALLQALREWEAATPQYEPRKRAPTDNRKQMSDPETKRMLEVLGYAGE